MAFSSQLQQIAEVLLHEGHGLRPGNEARGGHGLFKPPGNVLGVVLMGGLVGLGHDETTVDGRNPK